MRERARKSARSSLESEPPEEVDHMGVEMRSKKKDERKTSVVEPWLRVHRTLVDCKGKNKKARVTRVSQPILAYGEANLREVDHRDMDETKRKTRRTLGLHSSGVSDEEGSVVSDEGLLEVDGRGGVDVLGVELSTREATDK